MEKEVRALRLPKIALPLVSAMNRFFWGEKSRQFSLGKRGVELERVREWAGGGVTLSVRGHWGMAEFELVCRSAEAELIPLFLDLPADCAWNALPPVLRLAGWEAGLESAFNTLSAWSRETAALAMVEEYPERKLEARPDWLFFDWHFEGLTGTLHTAVRFSPPLDGLNVFASAFLADAPVLPVPDDWPIEVSVELALEKIDLGVLRSMEPGDIALVSDSDALRNGRAMLRAGRKNHYPVQLRGSKAEIMEDTMAESANPGEPARKGGAVDGIEVNLTLELDSRLWQARELAQIQPGYVFDTGKTLASPITLKINGREWGRGELVEIDGKVGVRLLNLA